MKVKDLMEQNVEFASGDEAVKDVAARMLERKFSQLVLPDGRLVTAWDIVTRATEPEEKVGRLARNYGRLDVSDGAMDALRRILESGAQALPVYEGGKIVGILSRSDLLDLAGEFDIHELMRSPVYSISAEDSTAKALEIMKEKKISRVAVTKDEELVGFVSTISLLKLFSQEFHGKKPQASLVMERIETPEEDPDFEKVMEALKRNGVFYFTSNRVPYAVVTAVDVLESLLISGEKVPVETIGIASQARAEAEKLGEKLSKMVKVFGIVLHAKQVKDEYEIKLRVYTNIGNFNYSTTADNLFAGVNEAVDAVEDMVKSKKSKIRDLRRRIYIE